MPDGVDRILARVSRDRSVFLRYRGSHFCNIFGEGRGFDVGWAWVEGMGRRGGGVVGDFSMLDVGSRVGGTIGSDIFRDTADYNFVWNMEVVLEGR